ncbi:uncharacterized protein LOC143529800 [Bidens hawaiensis]|uniref:uncharacterized protein LOC143529800 n=1 Tax=Bidens hawaiensis TaxID=980011 RepID=UPI00404B0037
MDAQPEEEEDVVVDSVHQQIDVQNDNDVITDTNDGPECTHPSPRINLADTLAAERQFRSTDGTQPPLSMAETEEVGTPLRISLMRLLEETETETDGQDEEKEELGRDEMCCVCMGRKKGAALIPCGHTYCRVCCRELWLNRGYRMN